MHVSFRPSENEASLCRVVLCWARRDRAECRFESGSLGPGLVMLRARCAGFLGSDLLTHRHCPSTPFIDIGGCVVWPLDRPFLLLDVDGVLNPLSVAKSSGL